MSSGQTRVYTLKILNQLRGQQVMFVVRPPRSTIGSYCSSWPSSVQRSYKTIENARVSESNFITHATINFFLCYRNTSAKNTVRVGVVFLQRHHNLIVRLTTML